MLYVVFSILGVLGLLNLWMYVQQPNMVFFPVKPLAATPQDWGYAYEDVWLQADKGVSLHGWYIPAQGTRRGVALFLHGNAGNISHREATITQLHELGLDILIPDYRGYGRSEGRPSETGVYQDAMAAWRYLTQERGIGEGEILVFGRSLGGAVAAWLASRTRPAAVVLESTFSSAAAMAREIFPLLSHAIWLRYRFPTVDYVGDIQSPVLVVHSPDDEIIPFRMGERIHAAADEPKAFFRLQGDHNTGFIVSEPGYSRALDAFISRWLTPAPSTG